MLASNMHLLPFLLLAPCYMRSRAEATEQSLLRSLDTAPVIHFAITRRDGAFTGTVAGENWVDLEYLVKQVEIAECRFNLTKRVVKGNKLVRKARTGGAGGKDETGLMGDIASRGAWYVDSPIAIMWTIQLIRRGLVQVRKDQHWESSTGNRNGPQYAVLRFLCRQDLEPEWQ